MPLFLTQGLIENNTVADGTAQYLRTTPATSARGSARGSTCAATRPTRTGAWRWAATAGSTRSCASTTSFLKGVAPTVARPAGRGPDQRRHVARRAAVAAGRRDRRYTTPLRAGTYTDDAQNNGTGDGGADGQGIWTISPPLAHDAHLAGVRKVTVNVAIALPERQPRGRRLRPRLRRRRRPLISRGTYLLPGSGQVELRPLRRRLEAPGRPPRRRAAHLVELGVVAAPPDARSR